MQKTNLNIYPYYDDFTASKNFHRILFRPGYAVQGRELTQIQTILQTQIERFGNHIFQHGSIVSPGNSYAELGVSYAKLIQSGANPFTNNMFAEGDEIIGSISNVKALVKAYIDEENSNPKTVYFVYTTGGTTAGVANGISSFIDGEEIYLSTNSTVRALIQSGIGSLGVGSLAHINDGIFYINGFFTAVQKQTAIIDKYTASPTCRVVLKIVETLVDESTDNTLLDPAQGSYNYAAPGANRLAIDLQLIRYDYNAVVSSDYVEIMRYNAGVLEEHSRYPKYSELEKSLARRTYDESGDYIVSGYKTLVRDHNKTKFNNGVVENGDLTKFVVDIGPGSSYLRGYNLENIAPVRLIIDRARTASHIKSKPATLLANYGSYIYVTDLKSLPDFRNRQTVNLYNDNDPANGLATQMGTLIPLAIDLHSGDANTATAIYKLYYADVTLNVNTPMSYVGGIRFATGSATVLTRLSVPNATIDFAPGEIISNAGATRTATVEKYTRAIGELFIYKHDHTKYIPNVGEIITSSGAGTPTGTINISESFITSSEIPLFSLPATSIKSIKNINTGLYDITYSVWETITITTDITGAGTYTIPSGVLRTPEPGVTVAVGSAGIVTLDKLSITSNTTMVITGGPVTDTVIILTQVEKTATQPKVKTLTTLTLSGITPSNTISLGKADIYQIDSIISGSVDVTSRYKLDNGQRDSHYDIGSISLVGIAPTSNLDITFKYFVHSGSGDYFSIDSYTTLGSEYIALTPDYRSPITSNIYDLSNYLDFRPRIGDNGTYSVSTASLNDTPVVDTLINTSVEYFVNRIDTVYIDNTNTIGILTGIPASAPLYPVIPSNTLKLFSIAIPAYTEYVADIKILPAVNTRFTMADINKLQNRVLNIENFSMVNSIENSLLSYNIVDAITGLNRFKTGYLVDNFDNPFTICDTFNRYNRSDFKHRQLTAASEAHDAAVTLVNTSTNYTITDGLITLPYIEVPFITQNTSTRVTNLNPFTVFSWTGLMTIDPPSDSWVVTEDLPTIFNNVTNTVTVTREERVDVEVHLPRPAPVCVPVVSPVVIRTPTVVTPTPVSPSTLPITVWARDLGLSIPGDANWDKKITFDAPANQVIAARNETAGKNLDPSIDPGAWSVAIQGINKLFDASSASAGLVSGTSKRYAAADVINFWTQDTDPGSGVWKGPDQLAKNIANGVVWGANDKA